jgi:hypothetical protein
MPSLAMQNPDSTKPDASFASQITNATTKAERDDARHSDLHTNYKAKDFDDSDKIFLLKREIDNLKGTIQQQQEQSPSQQQQQGLRSNGSSSNGWPVANIPLLTVLLFFGVVLVSARFLSRKLRMLRASESLLSEAFPFDGSSSSHHQRQTRDEGTIGFELQEQQAPPSHQHHPHHQQPGLFASIASSLEGRKSNVGVGESYEPPPEEASSASLRFV